MSKELIARLRKHVTPAIYGQDAMTMHDAADALEEAERKLAIAREAMQNLVVVKGRYHTEQAYNRIVEALAQIAATEQK